MIPSGQTLLFFSHILALPHHHGGCVYPHALLTALHRRGVRIDYAWLAQPLSNVRRLMHDPLTALWIQRGWVRGARRIGRFLVPDSPAGFFAPRGDALNGIATGEHLATPAEQTFARAVIERTGATSVLVDGTATLTILDALPPALRATLRVGVLTHNVNSRRTELYRAHARVPDFLPMTVAEEIALLERADVVVAIQEREAETFRAFLPGLTVVTAPMPVVARPRVPAPATGTCLFVGGNAGHNVAALEWLLREVWPRVRAAEPAAALVVAGAVGQSVASPPPGVAIAGAVADLARIYAAADLSLVPLPLGTGLKIKLVEAMGHGHPVVTTPAGAEGFAALEAGQVAVVASAAADFAAAVVRLLRDPDWRETVVRRQLAWLASTLDPDTATAPLAALWPRRPAAAPDPVSP